MQNLESGIAYSCIFLLEHGFSTLQSQERSWFPIIRHLTFYDSHIYIYTVYMYILYIYIFIYVHTVYIYILTNQDDIRIGIHRHKYVYMYIKNIPNAGTIHSSFHSICNILYPVSHISTFTRRMISLAGPPPPERFRMGRGVVFFLGTPFTACNGVRE